MAKGRTLGHWFLLLLALRLLAWAFLLPPWSGFDEAFHHAYVLANRTAPTWPAFGELTLSPEIADALRRWSIVPEQRGYSGAEFNYEVQQSPLYYWLAGLLLRAAPGLPPIATLYVLRVLNAAFVFAAGTVTWLVSRRLLGRAGWLPVAYLALLPGVGVAFARVTNDALAALLIAVAVAGTLAGASRRARWSGGLAAGLAPWAKLYGAVAVPGTVLAEARSRVPRAPIVAAAIVLPLALLGLSWALHGHAFPLQENVLIEESASFTDVPWAKNLWTIGKTHVFVAGVPPFVFPKAVHLLALAVLGAGAVLSLWAAARADRPVLAALLLPLALFAGSLLYHSWRNFSMTRAPGGTGGWYAWAMLLPESLFVTWGLARARVPRWARTAALGFFAVLTIAGDLVLYGFPGGALSLEGLEVFGVHWTALPSAWDAFAASRPRACAIAALVIAPLSWAVAVAALARSARPDRGAAAARPAGGA